LIQIFFQKILYQIKILFTKPPYTITFLNLPINVKNMTHESSKALIIFIKNPQKGKVKTRLARTVGDDKALEIYLELLKITLENAQILRGPLREKETIKPYLFYSDFVDTQDEWSSEVFEKMVQSGDDLGERMSNAFKIVLEKHPAACIIGSDCPTLSVAILEQSFSNLNDSDYTIGPSTDGGYYLLGIRKGIAYENLFSDIEWSTPSVLPTTLERFDENKGSYTQLPVLTDIDEEKDWVAYCESKI
jgi:uncharacterized protein